MQSVVDRPRDREIYPSSLRLSLSFSLVGYTRTASEQFESGVTGNQEGRRPAKDKRRMLERGTRWDTRNDRRFIRPRTSQEFGIKICGGIIVPGEKLKVPRGFRDKTGCILMREKLFGIILG